MEDLRCAIVQAGGLCSRAGLARRWGVSRTIVGEWTRRPDFPLPIKVDGTRDVWTAAEADIWRQHNSK